MNRVFFFITLVSLSSISYAAFEYEIWIQKETSLDAGSVSVAGRILNSGDISIDLASQGMSIGGLPSNLNDTTCTLECIEPFFSGGVLLPGEFVDFIWLAGTQEEDLSNRAGEFLSGSIQLLPSNLSWRWVTGGFLPEITVFSEWVNGSADTSTFNKTTINLSTAGQYIVTPVPLPATIWLFLSALGGLISIKARLS